MKDESEQPGDDGIEPRRGAPWYTVPAVAVMLALAAGLGVGLLVASRGRHQQGAEAEERYGDAIRGAALCVRGGDLTRAHHLLAACPQRLREWEWYYLDSIGPEAHGFPAVHLTASEDGMGFAAETDPGAATPPPEALRTSVLIEAAGPDWTPEGLVIGPGGRTLTGVGTPSLAIARGGAPPVVLQGAGGIVVCGAFSREGHRVAGASHDRTVRIWCTDTGAELLTLPGPTGPRRIWFSPDGSLLFVAAEGSALIYVAKQWSPQIVTK